MASKVASDSQIVNFYNGQNVLITGGTGFMGKILIEKLLRSTDVATIYLLIREKKGKNVHSRLDELFDNIIFERLKTEKPKFRHRVVALSGDCSISGLGLTIDDRQTLLSNVNLVFHVAATVRFDENLKVAYSINVRGTQDMLELCRQIKQLKGLVHVSTAYSNCQLDTIKEKFYEFPMNSETVEALLEKLSKSEVDKLTPRIIGKWPNTYTFTKALAESFIRSNGSGLPIAIFRPAIVISSYKEPIESWIDNLNGPSGACAGAASGVLHVLQGNADVIADLVPVDTCVAAIIATAWDLQSKNPLHDPQQIPIYNYVSSVENPVTWGEFHALNLIWSNRYPVSTSIWTARMILINNLKLYLLLRFLLHLVPALFFDMIALLTGQKQRLLTMYTKIHKFSDVIGFFSTHEWKFENGNVQSLWNKMNNVDREVFPLSMETVHWLQYFKRMIKGIRVHLLNDPLETLPAARKRLQRLEMLHQMVKWIILVGSVSMGISLMQRCWF